MALLSGVTNFLDKYILGYALGTAAGPALRPFVQDLANEAWVLNPVMKPDALVLAAGVAQGQVDEATARDWAKQHGFDTPEFSALIDIANVGPGASYAFELWRRGEIGESGFRRAVKRLGLEQEWIDDLVRIKENLLTPAELAVMVQRGVVPDPGLLPVGPPTAVGKVPPMPVAAIDTLVEAAGSGVNKERLAALARIIGLPASPDLAARMVFRGIIDSVDFDRAISEGNTRNEWAPFLFEGFREIPTAHQGIEYRLRGWTDDAGMYAQTARHGMSKADTDLLFKVTGRPLSFHQVFIGERRGGTFDGPTTGIDPHFLKSLQESNIRPEWYNLAWAQRHSYSVPLWVRALLTSKAISEAEGEQLLLDLGNRPDLAKLIAQHYAGTGGTAADPHVAKAQGQLWTTLHRSYLAGESTSAEVSAALPRAGVAAAAIPNVLATWDEERTIIRKQLSPAQVKKAYAEAVLNPDTGAAWTKDEATAALVARGYSTADATTFLEL